MATKTAPKSDKRFSVTIRASFIDRDTDEEGAGFEYRMGKMTWSDMLDLQQNMIGLLAGQLAATRARHVGPAKK